MSDNFQFDENAYARPNQRWVCGRSAEGNACPLGPTSRGHCRAAYECAPYQKGDTWHCARTKANGGACDDGPLPDGTCCRSIEMCQPVRSLLAQRGVVSFCVFAAALGIVLIMVGVPWRNALVSPGPLSSQHSTSVHQCSDCHAMGERGVSDWIHASLGDDGSLQQNALCLKCHANLGGAASHAHSLAPHDLERSSADHASSGSLVLAAAKPLGADHLHTELACATCHREHQGTRAALTNLTDLQCQVCHQETFASFGHGHPDFPRYPYERRSRIYFDHLSHYGQHFNDSVTCHTCHDRSVSGRSMTVRDFDTACSSCHGEQIEDDSTSGLLFARVPGLDLETLAAKKIDIGYWPTSYPLHVDAAEIPPLVEALLQSHQDYEAIRDGIADLDLRDLAAASDEQLHDVERLAWIYKEVLHDVIEGGQTDLEAKLAKVVDAKHSRRLSSNIPYVLLQQLQQRWLPNLAEELAARASDSIRPETPLDNRTAADVITEQRRAEQAVTGGWYLRDSDMSLRYRPTGHADTFMKLLLDTMVSDKRGLSMEYPSLTSPFATGRCLKCHTIDETADGTRINWYAARPDADVKPFTSFSHSPHLTLLSDDACLKCHVFKTDEQPATQLYRSEFVRNDSTVCQDSQEFSSNFVAMSKHDCAQCHQSNAARSDCLSCHNYHIKSPFPQPSKPLPPE